ncbi:HAD family hydrolase [Allokutzneria oryzae]|uniref:HAD family hydrolase n=1 Tax=Allokutzneria oryzae TaxID=1378989 RepID=A0ABV6A756_9PSEU
MLSKAVLFDLDGTLVDTPQANVRLMTEVLAESGRPMPEADRVRATVGKALEPSFAALLGVPLTDPLVSRQATRFRRLFRDRVLPEAGDLVFPEIPGLLRRLRTAGCALAVVTSKVRSSAEELLAAAGLLEEFDAVVCHGMAPRGKPQPDLALLAARLLALPPSACLVVGDAVDDVLMALAAGMPVVAVTYGVTSAAELLGAGATRLVGSAAELGELLDTHPSNLEQGRDRQWH